jgi:hypothetical protein
MELLGNVGQVDHFGSFGNSICYGEVGHVESCFGPFGYSVSVGAR